MADENPYEPVASFIQHRHVETRLPEWLRLRTSKIVYRFGMFQLLSWIAVSFLTDRLWIDLIAPFVAIIGANLRSTACKRFPWTSLICAAYPLVFLQDFVNYDLYDPTNWLPYRDSPVLLLQIVCGTWATVASLSLLKCFAYHRKAAEQCDKHEVAEP